MDALALAASIKEAALACGFEACGIIKTEEMSGYADVVADRIDHFPESRPMFDPFIDFASPQKMVPWAKSVVICASWYGKYRIPAHLKGVIGKHYCVDSRKDAASSEYQGKKSFESKLEDFGLRQVSKNDFGITAMRWAAAKAGLGLIRKNNFFYLERGSWCSLEAYLIDRELESKANPTIEKCPENCKLCIKACPTGALKSPFQTNGMTCVSFLNTFGVCTPQNQHYRQCGSWVFGCDVCQDVCPSNAKTWSEEEEFPGLGELAEQVSFEQILSMDDDALRGLLAEKFWYIKPDEIWKWKCNVLNAMNNNMEGKYLPCIERAMLAKKEEVRDMARWVFESASEIAIAKA